MSPLRGALRLCRAPLVAVVGLGAVAVPAQAAAPAFQAAPGRVVFAVDGGAESQSIPTSDVVLPNGGAVIGGTAGGRTYVVQIKPNGRLDPSFGHAGIVKVVGLTGGPSEILRQADGRLVIVGGGVGDPLRAPLTVIARLNADGSTDTTFGSGGIETLGIQVGAVALLPSGELVATGGAGTTGLVSALHPTQLGDDKWDVVELTSTGQLDPAFGNGGIVTLPPTAASGEGLALTANGGIVATGLVEVTPGHIVEQVTRLTAAGASDPTFDAGQPATVPGTANSGLLFANPDGSILIGVSDNANQRGVVRYTAAGVLDPTYGTSGMLSLPTADAGLLQSTGGGLLEVDSHKSVGGIEVSLAGFQVKRVTANGVIDPTLGGPSGLHVGLSFGGADQLPFFGTVHPQPISGLAQNSFSGGLLQRPDGSYLAVGEVSVIEQTGAGEGPTINRFAIAALTPTFATDPTFGGPATRLRVSLTLPVQAAGTAIHRHNIRATITASAPGDARIVIKAAGRVVAQSLLPVLAVGPNKLPVVFTTSGIAWVRSHPHSRLSLSAQARDLLTNTATATASGSLRS